jgi:Fe-S-cluster containining protein
MGIAGHLRANLPAEEFSRVRERIRSVAALYRIMDEEKRKEIFTPCPLLDNHRCGVYSIRPAACTGMTSYEAKDCDPASSNETVKVNPDIRHAAWGFAEAYDKHRAAETDTRRGLLEFVTALDAIVDDPACRIESWLAGEDVFAGAWISETPGSEPLKIGFL